MRCVRRGTFVVFCILYFSVPDNIMSLIQGKSVGKFLYSAVSSQLDRSKSFTLPPPGIPQALTLARASGFFFFSASYVAIIFTGNRQNSEGNVNSYLFFVIYRPNVQKCATSRVKS